MKTYMSVLAAEDEMQITVSMPSTGVFYAPGLARRVVLDLDQLPKEIAEPLKTLADRAGIFTGGETIELAADPKMRDIRQFTIEVEDRGKQRVLHVAEPSMNAPGPLAEFVRLVRKQADAARARTK